MRPIYLSFTFVGICLATILGLVANLFWARETDGFQIVTMPLTYITIFAIFLSLPFAIAIEACRFLKER